MFLWSQPDQQTAILDTTRAVPTVLVVPAATADRGQVIRSSTHIVLTRLMTSTARSLCVLSALVLAVVPALADNNTQVSPGIGPLPANFSPMGGIVIDMVGANGKRLTAQISPTNLPKGNVTDTTQNFWAFWSQTGFDSYTLQSLLGGGLQKVNIRITLQDGDSASPNPVYTAVFGANSMPYSGSGAQGSIRWTICRPRTTTGPNLPGGTSTQALTSISRSPSQAAATSTAATWVRPPPTNSMAAATLPRAITGFPGVYALTASYFQNVPKYGYTHSPSPVGSVFPRNQLTALFNTLATSGSMTLGIWDIDPGEQYYDFTQGVAATITDVPLIPPEIISFTANSQHCRRFWHGNTLVADRRRDSRLYRSRGNDKSRPGQRLRPGSSFYCHHIHPHGDLASRFNHRYRKRHRYSHP